MLLELLREKRIRPGLINIGHFGSTLIVLLTMVQLQVVRCAQAAEPNGISVGAPKVFDNRTLTLMLESFSEALHNAQFVDQKALATALGLQQGFTSTDVTSSLTASTLPIPGIKQESIVKTGNVDSNGQPVPETMQNTTTATRDALNSVPPTLDRSGSGSLPLGFNPQFGQSAGDLLGDQVNLTYQIFNLRMLFERSLTDRLIKDGVRQTSRLQAVLGFNVTLDPPRTANDAVAVVEIRLHKESGPAGKLSLISLMPQEKTYNAAALSTKSHAFAGSAVANVIQLGYSQRRKGQTFYLYRDTDTISYERMEDPDSADLVFGWMFRPVLGRRSISPRLKQLFAIIALPANEACPASSDQQPSSGGHQPSSPPDHCPPQKLGADVRTFWKKYDRGTLTAFELRDANRASRVKYGVTLSLAKPELFSKRYVNSTCYSDIEVGHVEDYEDALRPKVDRVSWRPTGSKTALISVAGQNFFTGTQVTIGDKVFNGNGDGLVIKSNQSFDLSTSIDTLAAGSGAVIGRYGLAVPLFEKAEKKPPRLKIKRIFTEPALNGFSHMRIFLEPADGESDKNISSQEELIGPQNPSSSVTPFDEAF